MNQELRTVPSMGEGGVLMISPVQMVARVKAIQQIKKELMIESVHFYTLGGKKKIVRADGTEEEVPQFSLGKAGAELLGLAFGLCSRIRSEVVRDDPNARFTMTLMEKVDRPGGGYDRVPREVSMTGSYEIRSVCEVYGPNGNLLAEASGSCNYGESAFRSTPYADAKNPVLKRAEKRALVAAMLIATGSSDLFTQDLEDLTPEGQPQGQQRQTGGGSKGAQGAQGGEEKAWMSDGQRKLIYAKTKPDAVPGATWTVADVDLVRNHLDHMGLKEGKPVFDSIAKGGPADIIKLFALWLPKLKNPPPAEGAAPTAAPAAQAAAPASDAPAADAAATGA